MKTRRVVSSVKSHKSHRLITWTPTAYRKSCEKLPRTKPPECRWNSSGTRWRTCAGPSRVRISSLSLFALSFKVFDVQIFPKTQRESGLFLPRFGLYVFVLSSDQLLLYTVTFKNRTIGNAVPRRNVSRGHSHHELVPVRTAKDEILDQSVAPERLLAKRRDMLGRAERSVDASVDD